MCQRLTEIENHLSKVIFVKCSIFEIPIMISYELFSLTATPRTSYDFHSWIFTNEFFKCDTHYGTHTVQVSARLIMR